METERESELESECGADLMIGKICVELELNYMFNPVNFTCMHCICCCRLNVAVAGRGFVN